MFKSAASVVCLVFIWFAILCGAAHAKNSSTIASTRRVQAVNVTTRSQVSFISDENCQKELVCRVDADKDALQRVLDISILEKTTNTILKRVSSIYYLKSRRSNLNLGDTVETRSGISRVNGSLVVRKILPINTGFGGEDFVCKVVYVDSSLRIQSVVSDRAGETHDAFCKIPNLLIKLDAFDRKFRRLSVAEAEGNVCVVPDLVNAMSTIDSKISNLLNVSRLAVAVESKQCKRPETDSKLDVSETSLAEVDKKLNIIEAQLSNLSHQEEKFDSLQAKLDNLTIATSNLSEFVSTAMSSGLVLEHGETNATSLRTHGEISSCDDFRDLGQGHDIPPRPIITWPNGVKVSCDTKTRGGGWTVIQRRFHGHLNFNRGWKEYEDGFGDIDGEFWLGLRHIRDLVKSWDHELRIDMRSKGVHYYAHYSHFILSHAKFNYTLSIGGFSGSVGMDSMAYHDTMPFSTFDRDNDKNSGSCAKSDAGGWWYKSCTNSNLNRSWISSDPIGLYWHSVTSNYHCVTFTEMKVRRK